jgi:hypothetical protein
MLRGAGHPRYLRVVVILLATMIGAGIGTVAALAAGTVLDVGVRGLPGLFGLFTRVLLPGGLLAGTALGLVYALTRPAARATLVWSLMAAAGHLTLGTVLLIRGPEVDRVLHSLGPLLALWAAMALPFVALMVLAIVVLPSWLVAGFALRGAVERWAPDPDVD